MKKFYNLNRNIKNKKYFFPYSSFSKVIKYYFEENKKLEKENEKMKRCLIDLEIEIADIDNMIKGTL